MSARRGASVGLLPSMRKMSKMQARQTNVVYSVTVPGGKWLRSISRLFAGDMRRRFNHKPEHESCECLAALPLEVRKVFDLPFGGLEISGLRPSFGRSRAAQSRRSRRMTIAHRFIGGCKGRG